MSLTFTLTEEDYAGWKAKSDRRDIDNHPARDVSKETFFDAMRSDAANPARDGFLSPSAIKTLAE
ncbi:MAG: hypothetical protein LBC59_09215 [Chitinispirillales bacterium]|jgi:hypothetical protein|nr:hypothetical protein [Chitinispirillales bacterium]